MSKRYHQYDPSRQPQFGYPCVPNGTPFYGAPMYPQMQYTMNIPQQQYSQQHHYQQYSQQGRQIPGYKPKFNHELNYTNNYYDGMSKRQLWEEYNMCKTEIKSLGSSNPEQQYLIRQEKNLLWELLGKKGDNGHSVAALDYLALQSIKQNKQ